MVRARQREGERAVIVSLGWAQTEREREKGELGFLLVGTRQREGEGEEGSWREKEGRKSGYVFFLLFLFNPFFIVLQHI